MQNTGWWQRLGLRGKLTASILLPAVVVVSLFYSFTIRSITANFDREYRERAMTIALALQQSLTSEDLEETPRLAAMLQGLTAANPSLSRLSVFVPRDRSGIVAASSDPSLIGQAAEQREMEPLRSGQAFTFQRSGARSRHVEAIVPVFIGGVPAATLGVYMSLEARDAMVQWHTVSLLAIGGGGTLVVLVLIYFLTEVLIVRPVARISRAASHIADGHLDTRVPELGQDEVGKLAASVNAMVEELVEDRRTQERLATTDGLTGLWNHRFFHERLSEELNRAVRLKEPLSLIMLDLDRFKAFNDTYGHLKGDEALRALGQILRASVRPYDVPCRYGGEEFGVIVPGAGAQVAQEVAERVRRRVAGHSFTGTGEQPATITASFGISSYPADESSPDPLVGAADSALYAAKRTGGNTVRLFDRNLVNDVAEKPISFEEMLKEANLGALHAIARAADAREATSRSHSATVAAYARSLGTAVGVVGEDMEMLEASALLHDVGKIGFPDSILTKPGRLTEMEWEIVRSHPVIGGLMVERIPYLAGIFKAVRHHHERWDAGGYPDGLKGEEIPLFARVLAIADAYEAMTAPRPYREALTKEEALAELRQGASRQFDPRLTGVFIELVLKNSL